MPTLSLCCALLFLLWSCGSFGTIKDLVHTEELHRENGPTREVRAVVLTQNSNMLPAIRELLREASDALRPQVGVALVETDVVVVKWESADNEEILNQVAKHLSSYGKPYDIAIAFRDFTFLQTLQYYFFGCQEGAMDDLYRRFIVVRKMEARVLMHELCHGFLFSRTHTRGLMTDIVLHVLPGITLNHSIYLVNEDRKEILANKWRDFSVVPVTCLTENNF